MKEIFYDWFGMNLKIFLAVNHFFEGNSQFNEMLSSYFRTISFIGAAKNFIYEIFALIVIQVIVSFKRTSKIGLNAAILESVDFMIKCAIIMLTLAFLIHPFKHSVTFQRPLCNPELKVHIITEYDAKNIEDQIHKRCTKSGGNDSLPSGHAVLATLLSLLGIQVLGRSYMPLFGTYLVSMIIARMAMGLHYPADILTGILVALTTFIVGSIISTFIIVQFNKLMRKYFLK